MASCSRKIRRITNVYSGRRRRHRLRAGADPGAHDGLIIVPIHFGMCANLAAARAWKVKSLPWASIRRFIWYGAAAHLRGQCVDRPHPGRGERDQRDHRRHADERIAPSTWTTPSSTRTICRRITVEALKQMFLEIIRSGKTKGRARRRRTASQRRRRHERRGERRGGGRRQGVLSRRGADGSASASCATAWFRRLVAKHAKQHAATMTTARWRRCTRLDVEERAHRWIEERSRGRRR